MNRAKPDANTKPWRDPAQIRPIKRGLCQEMLPASPLAHLALSSLLDPFFTRLARVALKYDQIVSRHQRMREAGKWIGRMGQIPITVLIEDTTQPNTPTLYMANHIGVIDALIVHGYCAHPNTYTLVRENKLHPLLPAARRFMIAITEEQSLSGLRRAIKVLRSGNAILLFARGQIEPDPALHPWLASESVDHWAASIEFFQRHVPEMQVVPVVLSGMLSSAITSHPLLHWLGRERRESITAALQWLRLNNNDLNTIIMFGEPLTGDQIALPTIQNKVKQMLIQLQQLSPR